MKVLKISAISSLISLLFLFLFPNILNAQTILFDPDVASCDTAVTFTATNLNPSYFYGFQLQRSSTGDLYDVEIVPNGATQYTYTATFGVFDANGSNVCSTYSDGPLNPGTYVVRLVEIVGGNRFYYPVLGRLLDLRLPLSTITPSVSFTPIDASCGSTVTFTANNLNPSNWYRIRVVCDPTSGCPTGATTTFDTPGNPNSYGDTTYTAYSQFDVGGTCGGSGPQLPPGRYFVILAEFPQGETTTPDNTYWAQNELTLIGQAAPVACTGDASDQLGYCFYYNFDCSTPPNVIDGNGGCPPTAIGQAQRCCVPYFVPPGAECAGFFTGLPGDCYFGRCPQGMNWEGINPIFNVCSDPGDVCCTIPPTPIPKPPLDPQSRCSSLGNIYTAVGCISVTGPTDFAGFIIRWSVGVAGGIAFVLIVIAAFLIITSRGDPEKLKAGKELLTSAVGGLLLIIFSIFLLEVIGVRILRLPGF